MKTFSDKICREKQNTHCNLNGVSENRAIYERIWKNAVERGGPQKAIWRMGIACWIPKAAITHSEKVILTAFPLQQWLHERASLLRYTYIACLV
jgi:hypothetical protein